MFLIGASQDPLRSGGRGTMLADVAAAVDAATGGSMKRLDIRDLENTDRPAQTGPVSRPEFGDPESDTMTYGADTPWV